MEDNMFFYPRYPFEQEWDEDNYRKNGVKPMNNIFTPKETMEYGNIFRDEYVPYLNYQPRKLSPSNEKEKRIYELMAMRDFCHDLKLYLDVYPNDNKRSGAYSWGCYDSNPFILTNFQGRYDDVSTLAHELGHSMHSYYSNKQYEEIEKTNGEEGLCCPGYGPGNGRAYNHFSIPDWIL